MKFISLLVSTIFLISCASKKLINDENFQMVGSLNQVYSLVYSTAKKCWSIDPGLFSQGYAVVQNQLSPTVLSFSINYLGSASNGGLGRPLFIADFMQINSKTVQIKTQIEENIDLPIRTDIFNWANNKFICSSKKD